MVGKIITQDAPVTMKRMMLNLVNIHRTISSYGKTNSLFC